jgi:hypothetical protein
MDISVVFIIIQWALVLVTAILFGTFLALAFIKADFTLIKRKPFLFLAELLLVSVVPATMFLFFMVTRDISFSTAMTWFWALSIKFATVHLLFEISGFYKWLLAIT